MVLSCEDSPIPTCLDRAAQALLDAMLSLLPGGLRPDRRYAQAARRLLGGGALRSLDQLGGLDGAGIRNLCVRHLSEGLRPFGRTMLLRVRASPRWLDPAPHPFQTHLFALPGAALQRWPALWQYPHTFGRRLLATVVTDDDVGYVLQLVGAWVDARCATVDDPEPRRRTGVHAGHELLRLLVCRRHLEPALRGQPWSVLLPRDILTPDLCRLVGRLLAAHRRHVRRRVAFASTMGVYTDSTHALLATVNSLVTHRILFVASPLGRRLVQRSMDDWALRQPEWYGQPADQRPAPRAAVRHTVTPQLVARLRARCRSAAEHCALLLLSELGLRVGSLSGARVTQVWDTEHQLVRPTAHFLEKGARPRQVWFSPDLVQQLTLYLQREHPEPTKADSLLFPVARGPRRSVPHRSVVVTMIRRLCRRAALPDLHCHAFRHYVINRLVEGGARLEDVSKWIGHRRLDTTFVNYYRPDVAALSVATAVGVPEAAGAAAERRLTELMHAIRTRLPVAMAQQLLGTPTETVPPAPVVATWAPAPMGEAATDDEPLLMMFA